MDIGIAFGRCPVPIVDNHMLQLFFGQRFQEFLMDPLCGYGREQQDVRFRVFIKNMIDKRCDRVVISHDDIMSLTKIVHQSIPMLFDPTLDHIGHDGYHHPCKKEDADDVYDTSQEDCPTIGAVFTDSGKGVRVDEQIEWCNPAADLLIFAKRGPINGRQEQDQVCKNKCRRHQDGQQ